MFFDSITLVSRYLMGDPNVTEEDKEFIRDAIGSCFVGFTQGICNFEKVQKATAHILDILSDCDVNHGEMVAVALFLLDALLYDLREELNKDDRTDQFETLKNMLEDILRDLDEDKLE